MSLIRKVLEDTNYQIRYNHLGDGNNIAKVDILYKDLTYNIRYDSEHEIIETDYPGIGTRVLPYYAADCAAFIILENIAAIEGYPIEYVKIFTNKNPSGTIYLYDHKNEQEFELCEKMKDLFSDVVKSGLRPIDMIMAKEQGIYEGLLRLIEIMYEIEIQDE